MGVGQAFRNPLLAGTLLFVWPLLAAADVPPAADPAASSRCDMDMRGPPHPPGPPPGGMGPYGGGFHGGEDHPPPFMMDIALTEDQQDKVFAITHAAAPALRDREKAARKAREALHQLVRSPTFSESSANSLAQAQGAAETQLALLRTRMEHDLYAVLTSEQQAKLATRENQCDFRGRGGPPRDGRPRDGAPR